MPRHFAPRSLHTTKIVFLNFKQGCVYLTKVFNQNDDF